MVPHKIMWPADHNETLRRPVGGNFSKMALADHQQPQVDHRQLKRLKQARRSAWSGRATWFSRPTRTRRSAWPTHKMWFLQLRRDRQHIALTHGPQRKWAQTWPLWTSESDVGQQPPEWYHTKLCGPLITMGPLDGRFDANSQSWPSRTAGSLRWIIYNVRV